MPLGDELIPSIGSSPPPPRIPSSGGEGLPGVLGLICAVIDVIDLFVPISPPKSKCK